MPKSFCRACGNAITWNWDEAFEKFGFGDGDGTVATDAVASVLENAGYEVLHDYWGMHNDVIRSISRDGQEFIPHTVEIGYDSPRSYLPEEIVTLLDRELSDDAEVSL